MRTHLAVVGSALAIFALPSCSALGLDQIPVADCSSQGPDWAAHDLYCATLVMTNPVPDACHAWECSRASHHCEILPLDADHDGAPSTMCAPAGVAGDCDDGNASRFPGNSEACNGIDDDCDQIIDEMVIEASLAPGASISLPALPDQTVIGVGGGADTTTVVARMGQDLASVSIGSMSFVGSLTFSQGGMPIGTAIGEDAMSGLRGAAASYALVVSTTDTCLHFGLFPYAGGPTATLRASDAYTFPDCPMMGPAEFSGPAVAGVSSGELLLGWYAGPADARDCGMAPATAVNVGTAYFDPHGSGMILNRFGDDAQLGSSVADGPPEILAVDATHFLVAYPLADGSIAVHVIESDAAFHIVSQAVAYTEPAGTMGPRQGVTLAIDPTTVASGSAAIALAFHDGCGATPLSLRRLTLTGTTLTAGALSTTMGTPSTSVTRKRLRLIAQPRAHEWLLSWDVGNGVSAQRFLADGTVEGPAFDLLVRTVTNDHAIEALDAAGMPLYRLVTVQTVQMMAGPQAMVTQATFGCSAM